MRQPNGRMSKKDRRAIQAFGLVPSEDRPTQVPTIIFDTFTAGSRVQWTWATPAAQNGNLFLNTGTLTISIQ